MIRKIGIDFGTCNIKGAEKKKNGDVVLMKLGKNIDKPIIPNVVIYEKKEDTYNVLVGNVALRKPVSEQDRIRGIKSFLQKNGWERELSFGKKVNAKDVTFDIMNCLYQEIHNANKDKDIVATITVPVNFSARQQRIVENAASKAGFQVESIISEPFAALFYLMRDYLEEEDEHNVLVFDMGGGTLDLCLATIKNTKNGKRIETQSTVGISYGGNDINEDILHDILAKRKPEEVDRALNKQKNILYNATNKYFFMEAINAMKEELFEDEEADREKKTEVLITLVDGRDSISFADVSVRDIYDLLDTKDLKKRVWKLLDRLYEDSDLIAEETTDVFVVGGCSSIPYFRDALKEYFKKNTQQDVEALLELNNDMDMDDRLYSSVAAGAAIYQELSEEEDIMINERIPFLIYTKDENDNVITKLTRNDSYKDYYSAYAGITDKIRKSKRISVYQTIFGEEDEEVYLGDVTLDNEIAEKATLYKLKVDQYRNIYIIFGFMPFEKQEDSGDKIDDVWERELEIQV